MTSQPSRGGDPIGAIFAETIALHDQVRQADTQPIARGAEAIVTALRAGGKLLVFGNGGSAADAQHAAAELVNRFTRDRDGLAAIALTTDPSVVTSIGNDCGFDRVFARQVEALGRPGDVALGITTSGNSANVVAALRAPRRRSLRTVALTGCNGGAAGAAAEIHINVPAESTPRVQEVHRTVLHVLCELVEREFADAGGRQG